MKLSINHWSKAKKAFAAGVATVAIVAASVLGIGFSSMQAQAGSCPSNDIMPCGAWSPSKFISKLKANNPSDMNNIYANWRYDLPKSQYDEFEKYAKAGKINPTNGNVTVDGVTVGYDGLSLGRNPKSSSTKISIDGKAYYQSHIKDLTKYYNDAMVLFDSHGNVQTVIMNLCGNPIKLIEKNPKYSCDMLNMTKVDRDTFKFNSKISTSNGASVVKVVYDFGDGTTRTETSPSTVVTHDYAKAGTYTAKVTAYVKTKFGRTTFPITVTANCQKTVPVEQAPTPAITIDKKVDGVESKEVKVGENFTYQIVVKNTGNVDLVNAVVTDQSPNANIQFVSTDKGTIANNTLTYTIPTLKVGESVTINLVAKMTAYVAGDIVNKACVDTPTIPGTNPDDCDEATVVTKKPSVKIDKVVNGVERDEVAVGEVFTYTLKVTNDGEIPLVNAVVTDQAPGNVQFLTTDKGTITNNVLSYTIPSLAVGQSIEIKLTAEVTAYKAGDIVNTACVNAVEVNPGNPTVKDDCDDATVVVPAPKVPGVKITKVVNGVERDEVAVGEVFTYTIRVTNTGEVALTNVVITDPAPQGVTMISSDKGTVDGNKLNYSIASLPVGTSVDIKITAKVDVYKAGDIVNTACVYAPEVNPENPSKDDGCDTAVVTVKEPGKVQVCNPATGEIIWVPEIDKDKYEPKDSPKCKMVKVCDPADGIIKDVKWADKDKYLPEDSVKCQKIQVCVITDGTGTMVTIPKDQFDSTKHSTNSSDCKNIRVCRVSDKQMVTIKESQFGTGYSTDEDDCAHVLPATTPTVLPNTGAGGAISLAFGAAVFAGVLHRVLMGRKFARQR